MVVTIGSEVKFGEDNVTENVEQSTENDNQDILTNTIEATFPGTVFKLSAALVFAFEVCSSVEEITVPFLETSLCETNTYWVKLITSTIVVNAP